MIVLQTAYVKAQFMDLFYRFIYAVEKMGLERN
jgi:hypothetical protein